MEDNTLVTFGGQVKALGDGKVGGYLVRYGSPKDVDLESDWFSKETDLGIEDGSSLPVYYQHGMDGVMKNRRIGRGRVKLEDAGLWLEAQLEMRDEYEKMVYELAKNGKLGWSSGATSHLVEREQVGKSWHVKSWPIGEASLTPTPAEPRNTVLPLKSLITGETALPSAGKDQRNTTHVSNKETDMDEKELQAIAEKAAQGAAAKTAEALQDKHEQEKAAIKAELEAKAAKDVEQKLNEFKASLGLTEEVKAGYHIEVVRDEAEDNEKKFKSTGDFFNAVKNATLQPWNIDRRLYGMFYDEDGKKATGLNEAIPSQGGFLVPQTIAAGLSERMYNSGQIMPLVTRDRVEGNNLTINAVDETSRANGSRFGGVTSYWLDEAGSYTGSKPKFQPIGLKLKKVVALVYATDEVLEDVTYMGSYINRVAPEELRIRTEKSFFDGTGVGSPQGFLNSDALVTVTRVDANNVLYADVINMWARRWAGVNDYVWCVNQDVMPELDLLIHDGTGSIPPRFIDYDAEGAMRMKGRPVLEVEYAKSLGTLGDISLVSWSQYQVIEKAAGIQTASSIHVAFTTGEQAFRFTYRVDGQSLWYSALTPMNGTNTQSPFVVLSATS